MTAEEKATELIEKFYGIVKNNRPLASLKVAEQCALIAVDEITSNDTELLVTHLNNDFSIMDNRGYWKQVKQEIEKL